MNNRTIDKMRDGGGTFDIGTLEDGAIKQMINIGERLFIIKEKSVYELVMADEIDPNRQNPNLPPTSQRLIVELGIESEMFSRTFLTAVRLFDPEFLHSTINTSQTLLLTLEIVQELATMEKEIADLIKTEKLETGIYEDRKTKKQHHAIPSIPNIKTRCKTIFQKADQALQAQIELIRIFYPDFSKQSYYSNFYEFIQTKYGEDDIFTRFLKISLPNISLIRNIRNCLDHRRIETEIKDFELQLNADILSPTIQVNYNGSQLERGSLTGFLLVMSDNLVWMFENLIAYLCNNAIKTESTFPVSLVNIPEEQRINKDIKFAYWWPLGEGGYYHQQK